MIKIILAILFFINVFTLVKSQTPDDPISPVEAVNMLGKGMLFEPQAGDVDMAISAPYKPEYGQLLKDSGFKSVRIRYQGDRNPMMKAIADGSPYDADDDALIDELGSIIDDLLSKDLAVAITFYGLTKDNSGDFEKMVSWWGYVANRFKNKSHKLLFNLFVEPWDLVNSSDHHRIMDYYEAITTEIRKTNPDRLLVYYNIPPEDASDNPFGPGEEYFMTDTYNPVPADAGIYYIWDFHVLKNYTRDNIRLVEKAWEYQDSAKQAVWSGAWYSTSDDIPDWMMTSMATNTNRRFIDRGISYAYLMMFDGHTGIYDAQNDRNENGILEEWTYPGLDKILVEGPDIWWNLLSNPGFELDTAKWKTSGGKFTISVVKGDHLLSLGSQTNPVSLIQDVTLALKNNGQGKYNVLSYVTSSGTTNVKFIIKGSAGGSNFSFESNTVTASAGEGQILNELVDVNWSGNLDNAELKIEISGDAATIDKTGLTKFFNNNPVLDISLWPGERINNDKYSSKSNSGQEINGKLRELMKREVANNNPDITPIADEIHDIRVQLEDRLKVLISQDYAYTTDESQYRTGGYYYGTENKQYRSSVDKYISGNDEQATDLNDRLIEQQQLATKYFVLNDESFRELYYDVCRDYPEEIKQEIPLDTTVSVNGSVLMAQEGGATYQWLDCNLLNNPILGATEQSFSPKVPGRYAVEITKDGFVLRSGCHEIENVSGIWDNRPVSTTKVYPNPAKDFVIIEPEDEHRPFSAMLLDIQGREVKVFNNLDPAMARISFNVPKGMYLLKVILTNKNDIIKLIVK
jgi:hypothetical protein